VTPSGETVVGFSDNGDPKNPLHYYLKVGESQNGWTVKEADKDAATMTIVNKEGIEVTLKLGGDSSSNAAAVSRAGATGEGMRSLRTGGSLLGSGGSLRERRQKERQQMQADAARRAEDDARRAEAERERAAREEEEKKQREAERDEQRKQLMQIQDELRKAREAREAEKPAASADE